MKKERKKAINKQTDNNKRLLFELRETTIRKQTKKNLFDTFIITVVHFTTTTNGQIIRIIGWYVFHNTN